MKRGIVVLLILVSTWGILHAAGLTLDEVWDIGLQNNLGIKQQKVNEEAVVPDIANQKSEMYPKLYLKGSWQYTSETAKMNLPIPTFPTVEMGQNNRHDWQLQLQQTLFAGGRIYNQWKTAQIDQQIASNATKTAESRLKLQIGNQYYMLQNIALQQAVLGQSKARLMQQLYRLQSMYKAKQVTALDTLEIANRVLEIETKVSDLRHKESIANSQLRSLLHADKDITVVAANSILTNPNDLQSYQNLALKSRTELNNIQYQTDKQVTIEKTVKSAWYPQLMGQLEYHYADPGVNAKADDWDTYYAVGLQFQWKLWDWNQTSNKLTQSKLLTKKLQLEKADKTDAILQEVEEAYENYLSQLEQLRLQKRLVEQELLRYQQMELRYQQAQITSLDLRDAEARLTEIQLSLQQIQTNAELALLKLQYATNFAGGTK